MPKAEFEDFWNAVQDNTIPMYSDFEWKFMQCDTNGDGSLDAAELTAEFDPPTCDAGEACPTENVGDYLLCQYNANAPLDFDTAEGLYNDFEQDPSVVFWGNCECLPSDLPACQEQWELDFGACDVTMDDGAGAKIQGQDDELCPQEIDDCFDSLCYSYICTPEATGTATDCNCDHYDISGWADADMQKAEFQAFWDAV